MRSHRWLEVGTIATLIACAITPGCGGSSKEDEEAAGRGGSSAPPTGGTTHVDGGLPTGGVAGTSLPMAGQG
ncbi:MAG TPA: hypothetical protein VF103_16925, partial [Polyangiaceae bacterium]